MRCIVQQQTGTTQQMYIRLQGRVCRDDEVIYSSNKSTSKMHYVETAHNHDTIRTGL